MAEVYTGEHVQKAIAEFHKHDPRPGQHEMGSAGANEHPKLFKNNPNRADDSRITNRLAYEKKMNINSSKDQKHSYSKAGEKPFPQVAGNGAIREFPLYAGGKGYHEGKTGNARIMMQENPDGGV